MLALDNRQFMVSHVAQRGGVELVARQSTAFRVWLQTASRRKRNPSGYEAEAPSGLHWHWL